MSKYEPLWNWIKENGTDSFKLTFDEIEKITGLPIDHSFLAYKKELAEYGFMVGKISMKERTVSFERLKSQSMISKKEADEMKFAEYQDLLPSEILETVQSIHAELLAMGFTEEIKEAKSGPVLSYTKDKKPLLNCVYRKSGIKVRLYAAEIAAYEDCLDVLPDSMKAELKKATDCKKLNGLTCTPTCPGGYTYSLDGELLKKCRSMAFLMTLNHKTAEHIQTLILREAGER